MKKISVGFLALAALAAAAAPAHAQLPNVTPFSFEVRGGAAFPTGDLADEDLGNAETGWTIGGSVGMQVIPFVGLGVYAGFTRSEFGTADSDDLTYIAEGFDAGVRWNVPTPLLPIDPWIKAGLVLHTFDAQAEGEDFESERGLGFEIGGGLGFSLTNKLSITPGVSYTSFSYEVDGEDDEVTINHIKVDVGLRLRL